MPDKNDGYGRGPGFVFGEAIDEVTHELSSFVQSEQQSHHSGSPVFCPLDPRMPDDRAPDRIKDE